MPSSRRGSSRIGYRASKSNSTRRGLGAAIVAQCFFLDAGNEKTTDAFIAEPMAPNFGTALLWNFTVSNVTGTYHYRSDRTAGPGDDLTTMWGNITISAIPPSNPLLPGGGNTVLIVAGVLIIVAVIAFAAFFWRRMGKRETPPPPPPS